jgi:hypothetical protein
MEVDTNPGDSKCETSVSRPETKPKAVAHEVSACGNDGNDGKCRQKNEGRPQFCEPTCAPQVGRDTRKEGCSKPFSFVRGRGKYRRLGGVSMKFNSGTNKHEQSSSSNSNAWRTSDLLDALADTKVGCDGEEPASVLDELGVKNDHD